MMKAKAQLYIVIILIMSSIMISAYSLRKAYQAESRATQAESRAAKAENNTKMLRLAAIIKNTMNSEGEKGQSNFQKAVNTRNSIYHNVPLKDTPEAFDFMNVDECYISSLRDEAVGHICGGRAAIYATALESQGIPARYVGMFSKDKQPYDTHATIEFWYQEKWYASDPTFNIMFRHKGEYLSYSDLYELIKKGESYEVVTNGFSVFPRGNIENYYIKLVDLMKYMVVHPSEVWSGGEGLQYPMKLFPATWDGAITFDDGKRRDVRGFAGIYKFLNQGPLR